MNLLGGAAQEELEMTDFLMKEGTEYPKANKG